MAALQMAQEKLLSSASSTMAMPPPSTSTSWLPQLPPSIDFARYLRVRFPQEDTQWIESTLEQLGQDLHALNQGGFGCGNYNTDLALLKAIHKKLKKVRFWGGNATGTKGGEKSDGGGVGGGSGASSKKSKKRSLEP
jgi:hypothetical protein